MQTSPPSAAQSTTSDDLRALLPSWRLAAREANQARQLARIRRARALLAEGLPVALIDRANSREGVPSGSAHPRLRARPRDPVAPPRCYVRRRVLSRSDRAPHATSPISSENGAVTQGVATTHE